VINGTRFVSKETKQRVLAAMKKLDYEPSFLAQGLRSQKTGIIGVLMPIMLFDNFDYYFMKLAHGVQDRLKESAYDVILTSFDNTLQDERVKIEAFRRRSVDGLVLLPTEGDHSYLVNNQKVGVPVVLIDRKADGFECDCVLADNYSGSRTAVERLAQKGHRRIGFVVNNLNVTTVQDRVRGYKDGLAAHGIDFDEELMKVGPYEYKSGYELTRSLLENRPGITALFFGDNLLTMGGLQYINERRISIPEQLALIGFDDFEWERVTTPPLSVVRQPAHDIGRTAAEILLQKISSPARDRSVRLFPTELIVRGSF
jgi:LacI family transcriptional regulator